MTISRFDRTPAKRSESANRKIGDIVYAILTANGNMADGFALFGSDHANNAVSGSMATPGTANIGEGIRAMGVHKDLKGKRRLNITPVYFLAPKALRARQRSSSPQTNSRTRTPCHDSAFASTRNNIYSGMSSRGFTTPASMTIR